MSTRRNPCSRCCIGPWPPTPVAPGGGPRAASRRPAAVGARSPPAGAAGRERAPPGRPSGSCLADRRGGRRPGPRGAAAGYASPGPSTGGATSTERGFRRRAAMDLELGGSAWWDGAAFRAFEHVAADGGRRPQNAREGDPGPAPIGFLLEIAAPGGRSATTGRRPASARATSRPCSEAWGRHGAPAPHARAFRAATAPPARPTTGRPRRRPRGTPRPRPRTGRSPPARRSRRSARRACAHGRSAAGRGAAPRRSPPRRCSPDTGS